MNTPNPNASPPLHEQLSYRPDQDRNLEDLPSDFYTIQLLALSNKRALEEFAASTKIKGYSAAEVEKDGSFFYVLLLALRRQGHCGKSRSESAKIPRRCDALGQTAGITARCYAQSQTQTE
ncbi:MAG: hypothetical protein CM1200mP24_10070 [Gammaproteobacteria bacterium]|nr:MAG: hypothetical protein CM1200mP24_10070 [Gammaproteobacteria bacterium]